MTSIDNDLRIQRFSHNLSASNTLRRGLGKAKFRLFGISDWVWWSASALAFVLWLAELPL